jgi:hypothetical protein
LLHPNYCTPGQFFEKHSLYHTLKPRHPAMRIMK